ncbi:MULTISPECIES: hypothetical protein [unclassified Leisingera]|uniref:hypothetical protein n=1 Tax=unclassified Leisingera TaxID=2614906 RepID=UPI0002EC8FB3|nr:MULTISPECIES: hypothetical protein [unclassified Leisingera]KIC19411.1 hypothetical protein RA21_02585 [Leisingera sp. ANG-DT]KIC25190.1 hypothetical protein RA23_04735 [Leisingera sp. ANG-S3]KIC27414.1 hypothetical protein RA24_16330 [Leisingera sp. ANG-M6]KIC33800.1 hypothetical protein RA25_07505 [Leisingera sp. ANG-S5]KIC54757.1 hypothetical protein RA22_05315 [Leisingera sp. ANG-S]
MRKFLAAALIALLPATALAQDSVFSSYEAYERFVDTVIKQRDFKQLITRLGGRDEYTPEQLQSAQQQLAAIYPHGFTGGSVAARKELMNGFKKEVRIYWNEDVLNYCYYYAFIHDRGDSIVVLKFDLNTNSDVVFGKL